MATKSAQSGLRSIKRDFSSSTIPSSSQEISWPPTPQPQRQPVAVPKLTGAQQRLKDIQDALSGNPSSSKPPLVESRTANKRRSPEAEAPPPAKRARQLPTSWGAQDNLSDPSLTARSAAPRSSASTRKTTTKSAAPSSASNPITKPRVAAVFLSQEQTHILKLVQEQKSIFYTGSAGQSSLASHTLAFVDSR